MTDIIEQIDAVIAAACGWCNETLPPDGPSGGFCDETHQMRWHRNDQRSRTDSRRFFDVTWYMQPVPELTAEQIEAIRASVLASFQAITAAVRPVIDSIHRVTAALTPAQPSPVDAMTRALEARRTRNTGPTQRRRAPRRIDPTRTHR